MVHPNITIIFVLQWFYFFSYLSRGPSFLFSLVNHNYYHTFVYILIWQKKTEPALNYGDNFM